MCVCVCVCGLKLNVSSTRGVGGEVSAGLSVSGLHQSGNQLSVCVSVSVCVCVCGLKLNISSTRGVGTEVSAGLSVSGLHQSGHQLFSGLEHTLSPRDQTVWWGLQ